MGKFLSTKSTELIICANSHTSCMCHWKGCWTQSRCAVASHLSVHTVSALLRPSWCL